MCASGPARPAAGTDAGGAHHDAQGLSGGGPDQVPDAIARAASQETTL